MVQCIGKEVCKQVSNLYKNYTISRRKYCNRQLIALVNMETVFVLLCILSAVTIATGMGLPPGAPAGFFPFGGTSLCRIEAANNCLIKGLWTEFSDDDDVDQPCNMAKRTACLLHGGGHHDGPTFNKNARGPSEQLTCDNGKFLLAACSIALEDHCDCKVEHPDWCNTNSQNTKYLVTTGSCDNVRGSSMCDFSSPSDATDCEGMSAKKKKKKKAKKAKKTDE